MKTAGIIPARYASTRLPGKPLLDICQKPMLWWVYQQAVQVKGLDEIVVATEDERILDRCRNYGIPALRTSGEHPNAASRLEEVSRTIRADFYVQINGDEPLIQPETISAAIPDKIPTAEEFGTNIITPMEDPAKVLDLSNIKVVFDENFRALYMSRHPIPCPFSSVTYSYYKHVGIIGYNQKMLDFYRTSGPGRLEQIEGIDTLRFLDYGKWLQCIPVDHAETLSVDTPKDLEWVRNYMETNRGRIGQGKH